jgi:hypothetical protein
MFSLFPYSTLGIDAHGYEGERYLYFPVFFLCLLIVLVLSHSIGKPMYLNAVVLAILLIHSVSLSKSAKNFRVAGNTNKVIISAVNTLNGIDTLYVEQLPQAQNGALIMRDGFREAIKWMKTNEPIFYITILSKRSEWLPLKENYAFANNDSVIDASETTPAISKRAALLFFSDSLLYVRKGH